MNEILILHGSWIKRRYYLWGETVPRISASSSRANDINPYDAGQDVIAGAVALISGSNRLARARHCREMIATLPTYKGMPIPSRSNLIPLEWRVPDAGRPCRWRVTALPLSYPEVSALFARCTSSNDPFTAIAPKIAVGYDVIAMADLWRFAGAVISRQALVPAIQGHCSRWMAVLDRLDSRRLANFAANVPPGAACLEGAKPADEYALGFFDDAVDVIAREAVTTFLTRLHAGRGRFYDLHSAWLASLRSRNPRIRWDNSPEMVDFARELERWRKPVVQNSDAKRRLGFRITDPIYTRVDRPMWRLTPVIVGGDRAVNLNEKSLSTISPADRENILIALGQASVIYPALSGDEVLSNCAIPLDASEIDIFLRETAPLLKAAGFGVFAPSWWHPSGARRTSDGGYTDSDGTKLGVRASEVKFLSESSGFFSLDTLVDVKWQIVLGDQRLSKEDVNEILSSGRPLVRWNSRWIYADRARLLAALESVEELEREKISIRRLVQFSAGAGLARGTEIDVSLLERNRQFGTLVSRLKKNAKIDDIAVPSDFHGTLRPYQVRGLAWLAFLAKWGFGACLADDMGLGKTIETISLFLHMRGEGEKRPMLVICPMSIMTKWQREFANFAPDVTTWIFHGPDRPVGADFARMALKSGVVITSYLLLCRDFAAVSSVDWGVVVIDEAQNIKNPDTRKSRAVRKLPAGWRLALTGTPVENGVGDLWTIMDFLNPGLLGNRSRFAEVFARPIQLGVDSSIKETLRHLVNPFILRRLKTDPEIVGDLPPRVEEKVYCSLTPEQAELYAAEIKDLSRTVSGVTGTARRGRILGLLTRLKQICNHPEHYLHHDTLGITEKVDVSTERSGKLRVFDDILDQALSAGECALVFTQYAVMGELLREHLRERLGYDVPFLHGGVSMRGRDDMVARFQRPDGPPVFILSIKAGGTGLDLTRANHVFHFDRWWNPAVENQATDRAHRIGQSKTVFVHTLICEGTLESRIDDLITGKTELARDIIGNGDGWIANLSDEKLREVLALSSTAVSNVETEIE